jgi:hypothetical protein
LNLSRMAAVLAAALLITACGGGSGGDPKPASKKTASTRAPAAKKKEPPSDTDQLNDLLENRANALEVGDIRGFVATATGAQVARDRRAAANAKVLPLTSVDLTAGGTEVDGDRATMRVDMIYRFDGVDAEYLKTSRMTAKKTESGWRISNDRPSAGMLAPWEYTRYKARTSKHFLALAPQSLKVGSLMKDLEKGRERMKRGLPGVKAPDHTLVIVARNGTDTKALTKNYHTLSAIVAVAEYNVKLDGPARKVTGVAGQRVFVLWRSYGNRGSDDRRMVIAHELTHASMVRNTGGRVPAWLVEGLAMYVSGDKRAGDAGALLSGARLRDASKQPAAERALSLTRLAKPTSLDRMSAIPLAFAYSYASAAAYTVATKHGGVKALLRLYKAFNSAKFHGAPGRALSDRVLRKTLHVSLKKFESEVQAYARANSSV